jgi:hypothetical protein
VVQDMIGCLMQRGASKEGIFRVPGNLGQIKKLVTAFVAGEPLDLSDVPNPHTMAQCIKKLFKEEIIEPVVSKKNQELLCKAFAETEEASHRTTAWAAAIQMSDAERVVLLRALMRLFRSVNNNDYKIINKKHGMESGIECTSSCFSCHLMEELLFFLFISFVSFQIDHDVSRGQDGLERPGAVVRVGAADGR